MTTTTTAIEAEHPEVVATVVAAMSRALTTEVTEEDLDVLNRAMQQVQVRIDAQHGETGRVTYDMTDDHPRSTGGRGRALRTVHTELPAGIGMSLAALSKDTGKDMAFLQGAAVTVLCLFVDQLQAGNLVVRGEPGFGQAQSDDAGLGMIGQSPRDIGTDNDPDIRSAGRDSLRATPEFGAATTTPRRRSGARRGVPAGAGVTQADPLGR